MAGTRLGVIKEGDKNPAGLCSRNQPFYHSSPTRQTNTALLRHISRDKKRPFPRTEIHFLTDTLRLALALHNQRLGPLIALILRREFRAIFFSPETYACVIRFDYSKYQYYSVQSGELLRKRNRSDSAKILTWSSSLVIDIRCKI